MHTLREALTRYREAVASAGRAPSPGPPVLIEAVVQVEQTLNPKEGRTKAPWRTQLVSVSIGDAQKRETERIDKMKKLLDMVGSDARVFYCRKAGDNESSNVCIGRAKRNDIVLPDTTVSSLHARLEYVGDGMFLTDLKSSNGTYVNKKKIGAESVPLASGDCVRFGGRIFYYLAGDKLGQLLALMDSAEAPV